MTRADVIIVGAGLLGCFAARALAGWNLQTLVLERREDVCTGVSRANTGILYPGYDNKPGSLKARLCVQAAAELDTLCRELDVPYSRPGSLMVACGPRAEAVLQSKLSQGEQNGVPGLRLLTRSEALAMEPGLTQAATAALYAPGTAVADPWAMGIAACENARANGVAFHLQEAVLRLERRADGFAVETDRQTYYARAVLNCAGLQADAVRELSERPNVRIFSTAADYWVLDAGGEGQPKHVLFFEPEEKVKGLTLTPTVDGSLLVGPTERPFDGRPGNPTAREGLDSLRAQCERLMPGLKLDGLIRSFGATRPNPAFVRQEGERWIREDKSIPDFCILEDDGLYSLIGVKTPGFTCAAPLGREMAARIAAFLRCDSRNASFAPYRQGIPAVRRLSDEARAALVRGNPAYGEMVCHCWQVSRGEIDEAIRRGAVTVDGVKRRTGAGMGRCQGGECRREIARMLAQALHVPPESVRMGGPGTEVLWHGNL